MVYEIEREAKRQAEPGQTSLQPSTLFVASRDDTQIHANADLYALPVIRFLARLAASLAAQVAAMQQGYHCDSKRLSNDSERLLSMHARHRDGLLLGLSGLYREPQLLRHSLAVAIRLLDMLHPLDMPHALRKAIVAVALVCDLGSTLPAEAPLRAPPDSDDDAPPWPRPAALMRDRLSNCGWLPPAVVEAVIRGVFPNLDSNVPMIREQQMDRLARLVAVVVHIDSLCRPAPRRPALPIDAAYARVRAAAERFDAVSVAAYMQHFGPRPIGSFIRFGENRFGWVAALDGSGHIRAIRLADGATPTRMMSTSRLHSCHVQSGRTTALPAPF